MIAIWQRTECNEKCWYYYILCCVCVCIGAKLFYSLYSHSFSFTTTTCKRNNCKRTTSETRRLIPFGHPSAFCKSAAFPLYSHILTRTHNFTHSTGGNECGERGRALANRRGRAPLKSITYRAYFVCSANACARARAHCKINTEKHTHAFRALSARRSCSQGYRNGNFANSSRSRWNVDSGLSHVGSAAAQLFP